jgi:hypothetical protein
MKAVIVFLAFIAFSQAANQFYFAGTTNSSAAGTSPQANYASIDANGVCTASATPSGYQMFTINSTSNPGSTFYWVTALFQDPTVDSAQVQVYTGRYNPTNPCDNITFVASASSRAPHSSVLVYLPPGLHDVVVTTTLASAAGVFAVHADRAIWTDVTTDTSPMMYKQFTGSSCSTSSTILPYVYYTWTALNTTTIDIVVFSRNTTVSNYITAGLFNGTVAGLGSGNATSPFDICVNNSANFMLADDEETSINKISQTGYASATFTAVSVTAGTSYTVVLTGYYSTDRQLFGIWTRPTLLGVLNPTQNFNRPSFGSVADGDVCTSDSSTYYWNAIVFTAQFSTYVVDNGYSPNNFDTAACLYTGNNEGSATAAPVACDANWLQCIDTGDVGPLAQLGTVPGRNYTIVQTSYSTSSYTVGDDYMLWFYTGTQLGPVPVTTTGVETTMALSSSSSASAVIASLALTFAAFFF